MNNNVKIKEYKRCLPIIEILHHGIFCIKLNFILFNMYASLICVINVFIFKISLLQLINITTIIVNTIR